MMKEKFIYLLMKKYPNLNYNILGIANESPKWNYDFYKELSKCKMALNLKVEVCLLNIPRVIE